MGFRRMGVIQTKTSQTVGREWIFSGKIQVELRVFIRHHQPMKHSYYKIICFQHFSFNQELRYTDT